MSTSTLVKLGYSDPRTDAFGAHPLLGAALDLNDGATFTLVSPDGLELSAPEKTLVPTGNVRTQGERITRAIYRRNRTAVVRLIFGPAANYAAFAASVRSLVRWLDAPPAVPITVQWQPPSATSPVYLDVVGAAHGIPADEREWLRLQVEPIEVVFLVRPGLRGDRVTLSNLVSNPGFEAPSGPAVAVFSDSFATLNAYAVQAGGALTQDKATYADAITADSPLNYFRCDETSGTTAINAGSAGVAGAYSGTPGPTLGVAGALTGDADTAITLAAANLNRLVPSNSVLPTGGNAAFTMECWIKFSANPASTQGVFTWGNSTLTNLQTLRVSLSTTGTLLLDVGGATLITSAALSTGAWHYIAVRWDGTTLSLNVDAAAKQTATPGALNLGGGSVSHYWGALQGGTSFLSGSLDECAEYNAALSDARISAHYSAGTVAPAATASTALLAAGNRVSFGSPAWAAINLWSVRLRYNAGATASFYLHYTDANNSLAAVVSGTALSLVQTVAGVAHTLASTALSLVNGVHYWLQVTQFPTVASDPAAVQAALYVDAAGAIGTQLGATVGPIATYDTVTALAGAPQISVAGASLGLGGAFAGVHTVALFGPGSWTFNGLAGTATGLASGAWEQNTANTYAGGAVTSFGAGRVDLPPAGTVGAQWESYSGGAPSGTSAIPASTGQTVAASVYVRSTGLSATATISLQVREWDASGALLRATTLQSVTGNQAAWAHLSGSVALGASTAYVSLLATISDTVAGASAGGVVWFDNAQVWNVTTTGVAAGAMPYCELRFAHSPAHLLVTGLLGDLPAPAHLAWGTYLSSWALGSTLTYALGRRAQASANARMVATSNGFYGAALSPTATPVRDASAYGGYYPSALVNPGWNPRAFSFPPSDLPGVFHLFTRFWTAQAIGNLGNVQVRSAAEQKRGAWYGDITGADALGAYYGPYVAPLSASSTWTIVDAGQFNVPTFPVGALTDLTASYLSPRSQWEDTTAGGSTCRSDWQLLLPVDGSLLVGVVNNPSNAYGAVTTSWLWGYHDGLLVNRAGVGDAPAATYSIEAGPTSNPGQGAGGPGTSTTGVINVNSGADPYLTVDPTVSCGTVAGVNQLAGYVADNAGAVLPLHVELQYSPLYLYPR